MFVIVNNDRNSINYRCFVQHTGNGTNYSPEFHDAQRFDSYEQAHAKALPHERVVAIEQLPESEQTAKFELRKVVIESNAYSYH